MEVYRRKFESEGWHAEIVDGHDAAAVMAALDRAKAATDKPSAIMALYKGHGVSFLKIRGWYGKPLSKEQLEKALAERTIPPIIPDDGNRMRAICFRAARFSAPVCLITRPEMWLPRAKLTDLRCVNLRW